MSVKSRILSVSDIHRSSRHLTLLQTAVDTQKPDVLALVGDVLDTFGTPAQQVSDLDCARGLALLDVRHTLAVRGNHEDFAWFEFQDAWIATGKPLTKLHASSAVVGPAVITGFPCLMGDPTAFAADLPPLPAKLSSWLSKLVTQHGAAMRTLWLMHEPPSGTPLSQSNSVVAGNSEWRTAIERFMPILTISGHDHQTPIRTNRWWCRVGSTTCVNVGQTDDGPLHYCVVEAEFADDKPSLPSRLAVTAYPWNETVEVYPPRP